MSHDSDFLNKTADRLGIHNEPVLKKSKEFLRVLTNKGGIKNLNDIARTVLCLDLACLWFGEGFDKETALKLSGLKKTIYQNNLHIVEKVLDLDKQLTVSELCVQLSCTVVKELAEEILSKYIVKDKKIKDLSHPQYVAASVFVACKLKGVSTVKPQFISISRLKPIQWKELIAEFEKFVETLGLDSTKKRRKTDVTKTLQEPNLTAESGNKDVVKKKVVEGEDVENYEVWKKRILKESYEALGVEISKQKY